MAAGFASENPSTRSANSVDLTVKGPISITGKDLWHRNIRILRNIDHILGFDKVDVRVELDDDHG